MSSATNVACSEGLLFPAWSPHPSPWNWPTEAFCQLLCFGHKLGHVPPICPFHCLIQACQLHCLIQACPNHVSSGSSHVVSAPLSHSKSKHQVPWVQVLCITNFQTRRQFGNSVSATVVRHRWYVYYDYYYYGIYGGITSYDFCIGCFQPIHRTYQPYRPGQHVLPTVSYLQMYWACAWKPHVWCKVSTHKETGVLLFLEWSG